MREEMAEEKRDKCPKCGRKCTGRPAMWKTIDGAGFPVFAFACAGCGSRWVKVTLPKNTEKDFDKILACAFCADSIKE